jgi:outer membrane receptor protein involved in Fe transport
MPAAVVAQTTESAPPAADPAPQAEGGGEAPEILVTARRRTERLMDVPVVVSVLSADTVARYQSNSLTAIGELTPTVIVGAYKSDGGGSIAIRGISSPANQIGFEQAVSVAIDGVQTSNGQIAQLGFFDIDRVEVLKGPQALFFGKNSPAGVISVASALPTSKFESGVRASYEFVGDEVTVDGYTSGPVTDTLGARLAVRYRNLDGWVRNTAQAQNNPFYRATTGAPASIAQLPGTSDIRPGDEELTARVTLQFKPSRDFSATLRVLGSKSNDSGPGASSQNIGPCGGPNPRVSGIPDLAAECVADNRTTFGDVPAAIRATVRDDGLDVNTGGKFDAIVSSLSMQAQLNALTVSSITGFNKMRYDFYTGFDQTSFSQGPAQFVGQDVREFSQELRLTTDFPSSIVNFVVGGYYQNSNLKVHNDTKLSDANYNLTADRYTAFEAVAKQRGNTYSVFGQAIVEILPTLELAGGARWTREQKNYTKRSLYGIAPFLAPTQFLPGATEPGILRGKFSDDNVSPEVTLTWTPDSNHTLFAGYRTGFKAGGFGLTNPLQTGGVIGDVDFESEKARGVEVGGRLVGLDRRLNLSVAAFGYSFKNLQVNIYDPTRIAFTINNAGAVRQRGVELEGSFQATPAVQLHGAVAYVKNSFRDFTGQCYGYSFPTGTTRATATPPPNCSFVNATALTLQQNFDGRTPARSPRLAGNAGVLVSVPVGSHKLGLNGDFYYSDSYYAAETLAPPTRQNAFWRFNAGMRFGADDDSWSIGLLGRNLSKKYYLLYAVDRTGGLGVPGQIGEQRGVVARGREIIVQTSVRF